MAALFLTDQAHFCMNSATDFFCQQEPVAIKTIEAQFVGIGEQEHLNVSRVHSGQGGQATRVVSCRDRFMQDGHLCLVFDLLGQPLPELFHMSGGAPGSGDSCVFGRCKPEQLLTVALQCTQGLAEVHRAGMIHADIKPANVMSCSPVEASVSRGSVSLDGAATQQALGPSTPPPLGSVKLVDLGNAIRFCDTEAYHGKYELQALGYRAPEVLLGIPGFGPAVDMWSLGIVLLELATGVRVVDAETAPDAVHIIHQLLGPFPAHMAQRASFPDRLPAGKAAVGSVAGLADLASMRQQYRASASAGAGPSSAFGTSSHAASAVRCLLGGGAAQQHFASFLGGCLALDARHRLTPLQALQHPFLKGEYPLLTVLPAQAAAEVARHNRHHTGAAAPARGAVMGRHATSGPPAASPRGKKRPRVQAGLAGLSRLACAPSVQE